MYMYIYMYMYIHIVCCIVCCITLSRICCMQHAHACIYICINFVCVYAAYCMRMHVCKLMCSTSR